MISDITRLQIELRAREGVAAPREQKPIEVIAYRCPICHELHADEEDAEECCPPGDGDEVLCPLCGKEHGDYPAAAECCLWHELDAPRRQLLANQVSAGMTWLEALETLQ
ncbi:hypothetical protein CEK28_08620 [Xenophilus sp. AP218F]|nr:hypothetical protein CEK28_08620 [Xenophilus sp. AP218F]